MAEAPAILFFDGTCHLCDGLVRFIVDRDARGRIHFSPLQSPWAERFLAEHGWSAEGLDTVVVFTGDRFLVHSDAVLEILARLPGIWRLGRHLRVLPQSWRDGVYRFVAARRHALLGRRKDCRVPTAAEAARFHL